MLHRRRIARFALLILSVSLVALLLSAGFGPTGPTQAALLEGGKGAQLLIGRDDDNINNPAIQPPDVAANQSLNNADLLEGRQGNDVLIGLLGSDVLLGGPGEDILVGGTEQGSQPTSDIIAGGPGDDEEDHLSGRAERVRAPGCGGCYEARNSWSRISVMKRSRETG
jgi:hypothetical protein